MNVRWIQQSGGIEVSSSTQRNHSEYKYKSQSFKDNFLFPSWTFRFFGWDLLWARGTGCRQRIRERPRPSRRN